MTLVGDLKALRGKDVLFYIGGFLATMAPGFLTVFYFRPDLLASYDTFKLVLLSLSLTVPVLALNIIFGAMWLGGDKEVLMPFIAAIGFSSLAFFLSLAVVILARLEWRAYAGLICAGELTMFLFVRRRSNTRKAQVKNGGS
jgi:hypothetical protein